MNEPEPQTFDELVAEAHRFQPPTMAESRSLREEGERRQAAARDLKDSQLRTVTWERASWVYRTLMENEISGDSKLLGGQDLQRYLRATNRDGGSWLSIARRQRNHLARRAINAWDMAAKMTFPYEVQGSSGVHTSQLFLGGDGSIYAFRGMADWEWERGVLIPGHAFCAGEALFHEHQYAEVRKGLANLVARYDLKII